MPTRIKRSAIVLVSYLLIFNYARSQNALAYTSHVTLRPSFHFDSTVHYPDSVVYLFNTNMVPKADNEYIRPLLFRIKLPPGLQFTYTSGFDAFGFRYPQKQVVYIYLDQYSDNIGDTTWHVFNKEETDRLLADKLNTVNHPDQLDIDHNSFDPERSSWIIKKGKATILLYNIQKENIALFRHYTDSFTFL